MSITDVLDKKTDIICGGTSDLDEIKKAEEALNLEFSDDYKEYLLKYRIVAYEGHELTGLCLSERTNVVDVTKRLKKTNSNIPDDFYVIEETGNEEIVIWQNSLGIIFGTERNGKLIEICKTLADYIAL